MQPIVRAKRQYSDEEKALALVALDFNGGNLHRTARELSIPRKTIEEWARGKNQHPEVAKKRHLHGDNLADKLEEVARNLLDSITPEKIERLSGLQCIRLAGICVDKMLQLRGCTCGAAKGRRGRRRVA